MRHTWTILSLAVVTLTANVAFGQHHAHGGSGGGHPGQMPAMAPMHQPMGNHMPPASNYRQPTSNYRPPAPVHQPTPVVNRMPPTNRQPTTVNNRTPVATNRPVTSSHNRTAQFGLSQGTNQTLQNLETNGKVGPITTDALQAVERGDSLTARQRSYLEGALEKNTALSAKERAAIASALQADSNTKLGLAGLNKPGGLAVVVPAANLTGGGGGIGPGVVTSDWQPAGTALTVGGEPMPAPAPAPAITYGVQITTLHAGPAAAAGLRPGDTIVAVNGSATPTIESIRDALAGATADVRVEIVTAAGESSAVTVAAVEGRIGIDGQSVQVN
jgi:hypothetical protein